MPRCLLHLCGRAAGPDRLADAANALATMLTGIGEERRDNPRRVPAQLRHIHQCHLRQVVTQLPAHQLVLALRDRNEYRLTARAAGPNNATERRQVLAAAAVEQRQMTEPVTADCGNSHHTPTRGRAWPRPNRPHRNATREETTRLQTMRYTANSADAAAEVRSNTTRIQP